MNAPGYVLDVSRPLEHRKWWIQVALLFQAAVAIALFVALAALLVTASAALLIAGVVEFIDWLMRTFR